MELIAAILAVIVGFAAGAAGLGGNSATPNQTQPIDTYSTNMCYNPEPNVRITLKYPDNFTGIHDNRTILHPTQFPINGPFPTPVNFPPDYDPPLNPYWWEWYKAKLTPPANPNEAATYNSDPLCQTMMMTAAGPTPAVVSTRTYIRVRRNLRVSSCKTDEMAGPYNSTRIDCGTLFTANPGSWYGAQYGRGVCDTQVYPELRKVAELKEQGLEIFWVPMTHNAACNYASPNCGTGSNMNLRDFIYVLNSRNAFDPNNPSNCSVKWDAGSTDKNACSHYFDVYIAEDVWNAMQSIPDPVPTGAINYEQYYFLKQIVENCQEQNIFIPLVENNGITIPSLFLDKPFAAGDFYVPKDTKIQPNPFDSFEVNNYTYFVLSTPAINPLVTSLVQFASFAGPLTGICTPPPASPTSPTCYAPIGSIIFKKSTTETATFKVYSKGNTPQTFYFADQSGQDSKIYQYTITEGNIPQNNMRAPALQLKSIEFSTENLWTWATPMCKPAIYLYPEKETDLNVKLNVAGQLTTSAPAYDQKEGWNLRAYPDGNIRIRNSEFGIRNYPYLYYEANIKGIEIPKEGWVIESSKLKVQSSKLMREIGFNDKEIADFLAYWLPKLKEKPYYFVTLLPEKVINEREALSLSVSPDTLIRTRFVFEGLDAPMSVPPLSDIPKYKRQGFVVTDWGGTLVGKSCEDVTVR